MHRTIWLSIIVLAACELPTKVGDFPADTDGDNPKETAGLDSAGSASSGVSTTTGAAQTTATTAVGEDEGIGEGEGEGTGSVVECTVENPQECPPPPEDWCLEDRSDSVLPPDLVDVWNMSCESEETTGSDAVCIIDGQEVDNCPPPPEDWCGNPSFNDPENSVLPPGLVMYWNSMCDDEPTTGGGSTTGIESPVYECVLFGEPTLCSAPPPDWCYTDHDLPLPEDLVNFWDTFCDDGGTSGATETSGASELGESSGGEESSGGFDTDSADTDTDGETD